MKLRAVFLIASTLALSGCFDKPKIEDRWTRLDVVTSSLAPGQLVTAGATQPIALRATVTYRSLLTGYAVTELRAGDTVAAAQSALAPGAARVPMAQEIDVILQHSRSLGRATRAVTGWDHLIQTIDFAFDGAVPAGPDSTGGSRLFLLCYLGSGERVELPSGADTILITPFVSAEHEVLPVGMDLYLTGTGAR